MFEDRTFSTAASVMHVFIVLATVASTVILVGFVQDADMEAVARSSSGAGAEGGSEGRDLAWSGSATDFVDFGLSVLLAADWLARCLIHCALRLRRGSSVAAADTTWLDQGGIQGTSRLLVVHHLLLLLLDQLLCMDVSSVVLLGGLGIVLRRHWR